MDAIVFFRSADKGGVDDLVIAVCVVPFCFVQLLLVQCVRTLHHEKVNANAKLLRLLCCCVGGGCCCSVCARFILRR
jgi:hypothetical protein